MRNITGTIVAGNDADLFRKLGVGIHPVEGGAGCDPYFIVVMDDGTVIDVGSKRPVLDPPFTLEHYHIVAD